MSQSIWLKSSQEDFYDELLESVRKNMCLLYDSKYSAKGCYLEQQAISLTDWKLSHKIPMRPGITNGGKSDVTTVNAGAPKQVICIQTRSHRFNRLTSMLHPRDSQYRHADRASTPPSAATGAAIIFTPTSKTPIHDGPYFHLCLVQPPLTSMSCSSTAALCHAHWYKPIEPDRWYRDRDALDGSSRSPTSTVLRGRKKALCETCSKR